MRSRYPQGPRGESFIKQADCEQSLKVARENSNEVICTGSDLPLVGGYQLTDLWSGKTVGPKFEKADCDRLAKKSKEPYACIFKKVAKEGSKETQTKYSIVNTHDQAGVDGYEFNTEGTCVSKVAELSIKSNSIERWRDPKPAAPAAGSSGKMDDPY